MQFQIDKDLWITKINRMDGIKLALQTFINNSENMGEQKVEKRKKKSDFDRKNCFFDLAFPFIFVHRNCSSKIFTFF